METEKLGPIGREERSAIRDQANMRSAFQWGVALLQMAVFTSSAQWQFESITVGRGSAAVAGEQPFSRVIEGPDGALYGTTRVGGPGGGGTLYKVEKDGRGFRVLHYFGPAPDGMGPTYGPPTLGTNGYLYCVTGLGGSNGLGTIFRIRPDGSDYRTLYHSSNTNRSATPRGRLLVGDDGALYGSAQGGLVFKVGHDGSNFRAVHEPWKESLPVGSAYQSGVIKGSNGWLYGTSENGGLTNTASGNYPTMGVVFRVRQDGTGFELLYQFRGVTVGDGYQPRAALYEASDGMFYGVTTQGGALFNGSSYGTIYRLQGDGTGYEVIHRFSSPETDGYSPFGDLVEGPDGALYGLAGTRAFRTSKDGSQFSVIAIFEGQSYSGPTWGSNGRLYGTTFAGLFAMNADGSGFEWLFRFGPGSPAESAPRAPLLRTSLGELLGTTEAGGTGSNGCVFIRSTGSEPIRVTSELGLMASPGRQPNGMVEGRNGYFYGTTQSGGSNNVGLIFRTDPDGRRLTPLYHFAATGDGRSPRAGLVSGRDGFLYGTGSQGGMFARGTIFKIHEDGSGYSTLYHFGATSPDGNGVQAPLVIGSDGLLYGVANFGGAAARGTIFRLHRDGIAFENLHHFSTGNDGAGPQSPLLFGSDGYLYGTTSSGGSGLGAIYRLKPDGSDYAVLYRPTNALQGGIFRGPMVEMPRGVLWGCALRGGTNNAGVIYRAAMNATSYRVAWEFAGGVGGKSPTGGLVIDGSGWLTGTTAEGGELGFGTIFRFNPETLVLRLQITGDNLIVRWERGSGMDDVETATEWIDGRPLWQPRAADIELDGEMNRAVFPLQAVRQVLIRVRRDPE